MGWRGELHHSFDRNVFLEQTGRDSVSNQRHVCTTRFHCAPLNMTGALSTWHQRYQKLIIPLLILQAIET